MPVNFQHPDYDRFAKKWKRCRDVYDGQDAVYAAGEEYLPRLVDQSMQDYEAYKCRTPFYNATYRTIVGLVGMMFRRPPKVEVPEAIKKMVDEDVTLSGKTLQVFAQNASTEALKQGRLGVLVDCPEVKRPPGAKLVTMADQLEQKIRPSLQLYDAGSIINWKTRRIGNAVVLSMVVLREQTPESKDEFEDELKEIYRVLDLTAGSEGKLVYRVRKFKKKERGQGSQPIVEGNPIGDDFEQIEADIYPLMNGQQMNYIPFVFISAEDLEPNVSDPPLIDLVNLNLSHYRTTADYEHGAHFTGLPTPYIVGWNKVNPNEKIYVGSMAALTFASKDVKLGYLEFAGSGLGTLKEIRDAKETQMAILGARMLEPQKKQSEAAESKEIHRKGEESMLAMISQTVSMGLQRALKWFAEWAGTDPAGVVYAQNTDFFPAPMDSSMLTAVVSSWQMGAVSDKTMFENLQRGEIIPEDRTFEEEQALIQEGAQRMSALNALTQPPAPGDENPDGEGDPDAGPDDNLPA